MRDREAQFPAERERPEHRGCGGQKAAKKLVDLIGATTSRLWAAARQAMSRAASSWLRAGGRPAGRRAAPCHHRPGWLSADHQVGQTGKTVHPKVYTSPSHSWRHPSIRLVWQGLPECIIAVNKNDTAPIFEIADYGICGDLFKVTPMLIEAIKAAKAAK